MSLRGFLKLKNVVNIVKTISTQDGMGGVVDTSYITTLAACALWQNGANNRLSSDKNMKDSTHTLCFEYGAYTFGDKTGLTSQQTLVETVKYKNDIYKIVGFPDNVMNKDKIVMQYLERIQ
jgi:hypothetical protein